MDLKIVKARVKCFMDNLYVLATLLNPEGYYKQEGNYNWISIVHRMLAGH